MFKPFHAFVCLVLMFHDVEDDGTHNYLVQRSVGPNNTEYLFAFNSSNDVHWRDGCYDVRGECDFGTLTLDPPSRGDYTSWGYPRAAPICNAFSIVGKDFKWQERSK